MVWKLHHTALYVPGVRLLLARRVLEDLKTGALATYTNHVQPQLDGVVTFGGNRFYPGEFRYANGSIIHVVGLDKPGKVMSAEYDIIAVNEATEVDENTWQTLKSRLRNGRLAYQQLIGDCNPSGPRHWLNVRCNAGLTRRVQTTHRDNPAYWNAALGEWTTMGRTYVLQTLGSLTGVQRKRLLDGVWAAAEGIVYPEFVPEMVQHRDDDELRPWRRVMAADIGSRNPTCIGRGHVRGDGFLHISREIYRRNMTATEIIDTIKREADELRPDAIYIDPSAKGYIDDLVRAGYPAMAAENDVLEGIQRVKGVLAGGFSIDPSCINIIDEFGLYAYPDNPRVETDKPVKDFDHGMDMLKYMVLGAKGGQSYGWDRVAAAMTRELS
jgi:phage terminase large subunit